ncbi:hypothetical protein [Terasakiella sp.]|uniref:hypothetical protein n=1 Tax=Terasakiella sp. TaxID=2034861 RepID=UPI003AA8BB14
MVTSGLQSVGSEIKSVTARQRDLKKQRKVLISEGKSVDDLDAEYRKLDGTLDSLRVSQKKWERAAAGSAKVGQSFGKMQGEVGKLARNTTFVVGAASAAIFGLANSTANVGDQVAKTAKKIGIGTDAFQELRYAAERSGVSQASFDSSLERFRKRIGEAAQGMGAAKKAYEELGLSAEALGSMQPDEALAVVSDRLKDVQGQTEKMAYAAALFGREGIGMLNMLEGGSEGLKVLRADAIATGNVLSQKAAKDAETFKDAMLDAEMGMAGMKNTIGSALMPAVTGLMQQFSGYMRENRDEVVEFADKFASGFEKAVPIIGQTITGLTSLAGTVGGAIGTVADLVGGFDNLGMVVGALFAGKAILSIGSFVGSVWSLGSAFVSLAGGLPVVAAGIKAVGLALTANPIGLIVAGIATAAGLVYTYWEPIKGFFSDLWGGMVKGATAAFDWIAGKLEWVGSAVNKVSSFFGSGDDDQTDAPASPGAPAPVIRGARSSGGNSQPVSVNSPTTITIHQQPGQDARELAEEIERVRRENEDRALYDTGMAYGA